MDGLAEVITTALANTAGVATATTQADNLVFVTMDSGEQYTVFISDSGRALPIEQEL